MTLAATATDDIARRAIAAGRECCLHCGGAVRGGDAYCCPGCAGAHALVSQLGLDAYYDRRPARVEAPVSDALPSDPTPYVRVDGERCAVELAVDGLHCAACVWLIEAALARDPDMLVARLSTTDRRLRLAWHGAPDRAKALADLVRRLGYRVAPFVPGAAARLADDEQRFLLRCMAVAGFAAANVMLLSVSVWAGAWSGADGMGSATRDLLHLVSAVIALPAVLYALRPFLRSALGALAHGRSSMDVPIVIGVMLTLAVSLAETLASGRHAYFESALMLVFFLLVGRYVERRARGRARSAAAHMLSLASGVAMIEAPDGTLRSVTPAQVRLGDTLRVATGERLVADAVLLGDETQIDNSVVSGESLPVRVLAGTMIHAGAINLGPPLRARVAAVGDDTMLARIARLLEAAEQGRGRFVALADRVSRWYAPLVHVVAALTFASWYFMGGASAHEAVLIAVAVLIVTCPCALALAQPAVATAVVGRLARDGVLVVSPTGLERLADVDTVVFDKTGTLTLGQPVLQPQPGRPAAALRAAAAMAANSRHPLARALVAAVPDVAPLDGVTEHPGLGLSHAGTRLGSRRFCGVPDDGAADSAELWLARDGHDAIRFAFTDALRPDAAQTVAALRARGLAVALLSGDRAPAVALVAAQVGIDDWQAGLTPDEKLERIRALAAAGRRVLMVGDGINDAPALAAAHASLSPGDATDVATAAADALFRGRSLAGVAVAVDAAQSASRRMRANLALALAYNLIAVPVAMAGLLTPPLAAAAMSGSSLMVVLNAIRPVRAGPRPRGRG
ncbi:heavy metal translocating P-type ATPase [Vineibacter terrae]|uniref:heavy metal translocating P-type ATPase n=1 Tax=Vineibacter terrae TaxID=2586908 RepID=UPI002E319E9C|nr:heavy metal translocating P-type ATPase [Vineibacter terrae]HEX2886456.1 heavy metal translocating P-type ATPase [Vineibacter terrae]